MMNRREKRLEKRNKQTKREGSQVAIAPSAWCFWSATYNLFARGRMHGKWLPTSFSSPIGKSNIRA
jgi:hypothetical protein